MIKKILIAGFEPFNMDATNPSGDWVQWMEGRNSPLDRNILGVILPVTFDGGFKSFKKIYDDFCPDIVVLTGLAKNRKELTIERLGINWVDARIPDNDGVTLSSQKIDERGPDGIFTTIDINEVISLANKGGAFMKLSTSAGEYVCNDLLYKVLCYTKVSRTFVTFIHLPGLDNYEETFLALETIINSI